jgi:hypothetical protein
MGWATFRAIISKTHLGPIFRSFFSAKSDFPRKIPWNFLEKRFFKTFSAENSIFPTFWGEKFSAEFSPKFSPEKTYEKSAPGHPVTNPFGRTGPEHPWLTWWPKTCVRRKEILASADCSTPSIGTGFFRPRPEHCEMSKLGRFCTK